MLNLGPANESGEFDAATARSECEIPPQCGVFYFEVKILNKGNDGFLSIGLITKASLLKKLVGWETGTIGYHGDDGCIYMGSGKGHQFGPEFSTGDTVGCGVDFISRTIFFTKNGYHLGDKAYPLNSSPDPLYAAFGMKSFGESVLANFGADPFAFDIEAYVKHEQDKFTEKIKKEINLESSINLQKLVLSHMIHCGLEESAISFFKESYGVIVTPAITESEIRQNIQKAKKRKYLVDLIMSGKSAECLELLGRDLLLSNPKVDLLLHCRLFIDTLLKAETRAAEDNDEIRKLLEIGQKIEEKALATEDHQYQLLGREVVSLIAYRHPESNPSPYLLSDEFKTLVSTELEEALLNLDESSLFSTLEKLIRAYQVDKDLLRELGQVEATLLKNPAGLLQSFKQD